MFKDWWGTRVWTRTTEVTTPLGFKFTSGFHPAYRLMRAGTFEVEETSLISRLLPRVDVFVDVGANLGYYTCLALQAGKPVIAFEPQQQNLRCLFQTLTANGWQNRAEVFPIALSDAVGLSTLYGATGPSASLLRDWAGYSPRFRQVVPVSTLDTILTGRFSGKRLFVKIDVEGAEYQVLKGASAVLTREPKPVWLLEICLQDFHPAGRNPDFQSIFDLFWENGYSAFTATDHPRVVTRREVADWVGKGTAGSDSWNYLFVEPEDVLRE